MGALKGHPRILVAGASLLASTALVRCTPFDGSSEDGAGPAIADDASAAADVPSDGGPVVVGDATAASDAVAPPGCDTTKPFGSPMLVTIAGASTGDGDFRLSPDLQTAYFDSKTRGDAASGYDIFKASRASATSFVDVQPLTAVNSVSIDVKASVGSDPDHLVFESGRGPVSNDLYVATRATTADFDVPMPLAINDPATSDGTPFLSPTDGSLYFSSERDAGQSGFGLSNIWVAAQEAPGLFGTPVLVGGINTEQGEVNPAVTGDGLTIYWSTTRSGGKGAQDIWTATRAHVDEAFVDAKPVGELNGTGNDQVTYITPDGCAIYYQSSSIVGAVLYAVKGQ